MTTFTVTSLALSPSGPASVVGVRQSRDVSQTFAQSYNPGDDVSELPDKVKAVLDLWWDEETVAAYQKLVDAANELG